ncbi:hypothetical protein JCM6882_005573 [Rhodosporidiobolus microsporus]
MAPTPNSVSSQSIEPRANLPTPTPGALDSEQRSSSKEKNGERFQVAGSGGDGRTPSDVNVEHADTVGGSASQLEQLTPRQLKMVVELAKCLEMQQNLEAPPLGSDWLEQFRLRFRLKEEEGKGKEKEQAGKPGGPSRSTTPRPVDWPTGRDSSQDGPTAGWATRPKPFFPQPYQLRYEPDRPSPDGDSSNTEGTSGWITSSSSVDPPSYGEEPPRTEDLEAVAYLEHLEARLSETEEHLRITQRSLEQYREALFEKDVVEEELRELKERVGAKIKRVEVRCQRKLEEKEQEIETLKYELMVKRLAAESEQERKGDVSDTNSISCFSDLALDSDVPSTSRRQRNHSSSYTGESSLDNTASEGGTTEAE